MSANQNSILQDQSSGTGSSVPRRRAPVQQRSRERVEAILDAASEIIGRDGAERMRMSDVASRSSMSLGALYQYFPDKAAIVHTLAQRFNDESRECIASALDEVDGRVGFAKAFDGLVREYLGMMRDRPVIRDVWSGMLADRRLSDLQTAETRRCALLLSEALARCLSAPANDDLRMICLVVWDLGESVIRLALTLPHAEGDAAIDTYIRMALREMVGIDP